MRFEQGGKFFDEDELEENFAEALGLIVPLSR